MKSFKYQKNCMKIQIKNHIVIHISHQCKIQHRLQHLQQQLHHNQILDIKDSNLLINNLLKMIKNKFII